ncbi:MAG: hypothetical protein A2086_08470 [Spirochaetes bacterium GWD1_27_9]|nr:MAG: hypothetical protein A2Z98_00245 [Spirochaetes bacterium GWB1_27_13]OHD20835.1 MAG: hypothetical protein A2Y34_12745 [Spirochaetes bacterium GWC1_27_15]OHD30615.1 MAG: hypothetical protein A2086_08470 [Spirochaetes bacterium GWD1_27_9]
MESYNINEMLIKFLPVLILTFFGILVLVFITGGIVYIYHDIKKKEIPLKLIGTGLITGSICLCLIFFLAGIALLGSFYDKINLYNNGIKSEGVIKSFILVEKKRSGSLMGFDTYYQPVVNYKIDNEEISFENFKSYWINTYYVGDTVKIIYDKNNPTHAMIDDKELQELMKNNLLFGLVIVFGCFAPIIFAIVRIYMIKNKRIRNIAKNS